MGGVAFVSRFRPICQHANEQRTDPPQALQTISVRVEKSERSSCRVMAPGMAS